MKMEELQKAYPAIPPECHDALWMAACSIQEKKGGRRRLSFALVVILCLLLVLAGAALAFTQFGILNFGRLKAASNNYSLPEVESLVSVGLAEKTLKRVKVEVKEAYYDGRVLEILLSISSLAQGSSDRMYKDVYEGSNWELDNAWNDLQLSHGYININGQQMNIRSSDFQPGDTSGEYQYLVDSALEYEVGTTGEMKILRPKGSMEVSIDIVGYPKEDAITFTLPVPEESKWSLPLPPPIQVNGCTLTFTDLHFSPINTYIEYAVQMPASMVPEGALEDAGEADLALFDLQGRFCPMGLVDEKGEQLPGIGKAGGSRECRRLDNGDLWTVYYVEYSANGEYPDTIYLSVDGAMVPIHMENSSK
jgi:hypothetical protein